MQSNRFAGNEDATWDESRMSVFGLLVETVGRVESLEKSNAELVTRERLSRQRNLLTGAAGGVGASGGLFALIKVLGPVLAEKLGGG